MAAETDNRVLPETVDIPEAAARMGDVELSASIDEGVVEAPPADAQPERASEEAPISDSASPPVEGPPDYWRPEEKALWAELPQPLRAMLARYEHKRIALGRRKAREVAQANEEAARERQAAKAAFEQAAAWWQKNGPAFRKAFVDKWSGIDWKALAEKDPAEVQRLVAQRQEEETLLADAERRGKADMAAVEERAQRELLAARQAEHAKLAERLPEFFGPERARQTYDELSRFLFAKGIPAERIAAIYEAPVIELALSAMRFERAQHALRSSNGAKQGHSARPTPTRIAPGPGNAPGSRSGEAIRKAEERFKQSGGASIADAAELIRLSGL